MDEGVPSRKGPIGALFFWLLIWYVMYSTQARREAGAEELHHYRAKARAGAAILKPIEEALGTTGIMLLGLLVTAGLVFWLVRVVQIRQKAAEEARINDLRARQWARRQQLERGGE